MKTFSGIKTYEQIKAQCKEQGVVCNDRLYCRSGWDTIVVGDQKNEGGYAVYNTFNGRFHGKTPEGIEFFSSATTHENEPWFQALMSFFYVEA